MSSIPAREPVSCIANDYLQWQRTDSSYPPSAGWAYTAALRGPSNLDITADSDGIFSHAAPASSGDYYLQVYVTKAAERHTIYTGTLTITRDLSAINNVGYDGRTQTKIILDALDAVIGKRATTGDQSVTIDGTRLDKMLPADLLKWRSVYATKYWRECNPGKLCPTISTAFPRY